MKYFMSLVCFILIACSSNHSNEKFMKDDLNADNWIQRFESNEREVYKFRYDIIREMNLSPGQVVADIGAGTGAFLGPLSQAVTESSPASSIGKVYGVDISDKFVSYMRKRVETEKLKGVEVILGEFDSTTLPIESVDVVFISDTYHHFDKPEQMLSDIRKILRPGGTMFIIDFDKSSPHLSSFMRKHIVSSKEDYINQITENGFKFLKAYDLPLKENFMVSFKVVK